MKTENRMLGKAKEIDAKKEKTATKSNIEKNKGLGWRELRRTVETNLETFGKHK